MSLVSIICVLFIPFAFIAIQSYVYVKRFLWQRKHSKTVSIGFFHPYCNAGGGGERVLWTAIRAVQKKHKDVHCVVYSGDPVAAKDILKNVELWFNIKLLREIDVIFLKKRFLVEAKYYPFLTLLLQSLGSVFLGLEALLKFAPDIYIDTMGYAWTLPIFKFLGSCRVGAYVHFPTISTDMLEVVKTRQIAVNNRRFISNNKFFSYLKLIYYKIFAYFYGLVGRRAEIVMVNSSWTRNHIVDLWRKPQRTFTVYPPCDVSEFSCIPLDVHENNTRILSIAQFRPEKDHELQIKAFHNFLNRSDHSMNPPKLVLIGSCRHEEDYQRVENLQDLCEKLNLSQNVEFRVNLTFQEIVQEMQNSSVALHTMKDEHFGIGIVECMAAGLIMIAHDSGGPKIDIVIDFNGKKTGFLANSVITFANAIEQVWKMEHRHLQEIRNNARESVSRFSVDAFEKAFLSALAELLQ